MGKQQTAEEQISSSAVFYGQLLLPAIQVPDKENDPDIHIGHISRRFSQIIRQPLLDQSEKSGSGES